MPFNHLILCCPLLPLPSVFPNIRVFSNESAVRIRWPKYCSFSFSTSPSNEYSVLIPFRIEWFDCLAAQGTLKSLQYHSMFIPRYFILFVTVINGIFSLIFLSDSSLLVYRNATCFCILVLYPANLQNLLMSFISFLVASLDFLYIELCNLHTVQTVTVLLPFQFGFLLLFSLCYD